jgi:hypothetical protein
VEDTLKISRAKFTDKQKSRRSKIFYVEWGSSWQQGLEQREGWMGEG